MENKIKNCVDEWMDCFLDYNGEKEAYLLRWDSSKYLKDNLTKLFNSELEKERERIRDILKSQYLYDRFGSVITDYVITEIDNNQEKEE